MRGFFLISGLIFCLLFCLRLLWNGRIGFFGCLDRLEMIGERRDGNRPFVPDSNSV